MKTIKIILSIAGIVTTSFCFGQLFSQNNKEELYYTAYFDISNNRMEHHIDHFPARTGMGDYFDVPSLSRTYFVPIEYDIPVESWMTSPFESTYYEQEILVESWMEGPFESSYYEQEVPVESWMEAPFESNYYEAALEVEYWMTRPFSLKGQAVEVLDEEIEVETWMSKPWI